MVIEPECRAAYEEGIRSGAMAAYTRMRRSPEARDRIDAIVAMRDEGRTWREVGKAFGITANRVEYIVERERIM